jgi:hypothetical protein
MFAVITVHSKRAIDPAFFTNVPPLGALDDAYAKTRFSSTPETKNQVVYWKISGTTVALVFPNGATGFETHVENYIGASNISNLKREAENLLRILQDTARARGVSFDDMRISIHAEDHLIQEGTPAKFWRFLGRQFLDKMLTNLLIALAAGVVGMVTSKEPAVAVLSFLGVLAALAVRIIVEAFHFKSEITYADS